MVSQDSLLVTLVKLVDRLPMPALPSKRGRGHPQVYSNRLFLKALVMMLVRHLHKVHELPSRAHTTNRRNAHAARPVDRAGTLPITSYLGTPNVRTPGDAPCPNWLSGSSFGGPDLTVADVWASGC